MKKLLLVLLVAVGFAAPVFSQDEESLPENKHNPFDHYFGVSVGAGGMKMSDNGIFTADIGVTYDFYFNRFFSVNSGLFFHTELFSGENLLTGGGGKQFPLCFTIPLGIHINIPKAEWLYAGINIALNIPTADFMSSNGDGQFNEKIFLSIPVDLGFDFIKPGQGGSRAFLRVTPTFHKDGFAMPVGIMWQIYNWKIFAKKVEVNVPQPVVIIPNR